jgi:hypothetical protein
MLELLCYLLITNGIFDIQFCNPNGQAGGCKSINRSSNVRKVWRIAEMALEPDPKSQVAVSGKATNVFQLLQVLVWL